MRKVLKTGLLLCAIILYFNTSGQNSNDVLIPLAPDSANALSVKLNYKIVKLAAGPYSNPIWSPDGKRIAFTDKGQQGIMIIDKEGKDIKILSNEIGVGYKFSWSLDNDYIAYRATRFDGNKRMQFIEVVNVNDTSKSILVFKNGIQPPVWQYSEKGKRVAYVINNKVTFSDYYSYASEEYKSLYKSLNINKFFYYKSGHLYLVNDVALIEESESFEGMDPVISPDRKSYIYSWEGKLHLRTFDSKAEIVLGIGSHPSWSPDSFKIVYQKTTDDGHVITGADLFIMDISTMQSYPLTDTKAVFEVNPSWSADGKNIVFNDETDGTIYLLTFN